jgi:DNA-binding MarR family transcriptional regulator
VKRPSQDDYRRLLAFRTGLRRFVAWSEGQAKAAGLTPKQHQLMLAIRGHDDPRGPTIKDVADYLMLRHNSAVELVNRAEAAGFVRREQSDGDRRMVRLRLTARGQERLEALAGLTLEELKRYEPAISRIFGTTSRR